jgi:cell division protease FtsH
MKNQLKNSFVWIAIFFVAMYLGSLFVGDTFKESQQLSYSEFLKAVDSKEISTLDMQGKHIEGTFTNGTKFRTYITYADPEIINQLYKNGANVKMSEPDTKMNSFFGILLSWLPMLVLIGVWLFFMRQMQGGGGKAMGFGRSKAKLMGDKGPKVTFKDVAGIEEAKEELVEIVEFLRDPMKFQKLGGKIPKGCLLIGAPGNGKTLLARAIAGEANVPFFSISGSEFVEMFVGVGASRVRDMFEQGKKNAPCIIFIDEIDAVGRHRGIGMGGGNDEREQTLNQILVEMDGFEASEGIIIIAATNRPDVLDKALLRPGRFDRQITVNHPDVKGREQILNVHLKKVKHDSSIDVKIIARGTPGFSGAELANLVNEGALLAAKKNKKFVTMADLESAKDKILMGVERHSMIMNDKEKKITAYHEAGHALVALNVKESDPIHKATIIPRGRALGLVMRLPEEDRLSQNRDHMESNIAVAMGGRVAEEIIFGSGKVTSGAMSDIQQATREARSMVMYYGFSDVIGPILHSPIAPGTFEGSHPIDSARSDKTAEIIDQEVRVIIDRGYQFAKKILTDNIAQLHLLANNLIEKETLSGDEIKALLNINITEKPLTKSSKKKLEDSSVESSE